MTTFHDFSRSASPGRIAYDSQTGRPVGSTLEDFDPHSFLDPETMAAILDIAYDGSPEDAFGRTAWDLPAYAQLDPLDGEYTPYVDAC